MNLSVHFKQLPSRHSKNVKGKMWSSRLRTFLKMHPVLREIRVKKKNLEPGLC